MPKFKVPVASGDPHAIRRALDGVPGVSVYPASVASSVVGETEAPSGGRRVTAVVDADDEEAALQRVREVVGDECEVGPAEPMAA